MIIETWYIGFLWAAVVVTVCISTLTTFLSKTQACYICQKLVSTEEIDNHLLEHVPTDEEPTEQAVSQADFLSVNLRYIQQFCLGLLAIFLQTEVARWRP